MKRRYVLGIVFVCILVIAMFAMAGCGSGEGQSENGGASGSGTSSASGSGGKVLEEKTFKIEEDQLVAALGDGAAVDFGCLLNPGDELTIKKVEAAHPDSDVEIYAYDFTLSSGQPEGVLELIIPYDESGVAGEEEHLSVCGKYFNEQSGEWEDVHYFADTAANKVHILTDHLSKFGVFKIKNPGKRDEYVSGINSFVSYVDTPDAEKILKIYAQREPGWMEDLVGAYLGATGTYDYYVASNLSTLLSLGGKYDALVSKSFQDGMTNLSIGTATLQLAYDAYTNGIASKQTFKSSLELLTTIVISKASPNIQLAFVAIGVAQMAINDVMTYAIETKYESTKNMYDAYYRRPENKRTAAQWRQIFEKIYKENLLTPEKALAEMYQEIDDYVYKFWEVAATDWDSWIDAYDKNATMAKYPWPVRSDQIKISNNHKSELYVYLQPVFRIISREMYYACMDERDKHNKRVAEVLNEVYTLHISEDEHDGESQWAGAIVRLTPVSENTSQSDWTIRLDKNGAGTMTFTLQAHMTADFPTHLEVYKTEEDLKSGKISYEKDLETIAQTDINVVLPVEKDEEQESKFVGKYDVIVKHQKNGKESNAILEVSLSGLVDEGMEYLIVCKDISNGDVYIDCYCVLSDEGDGYAGLWGITFKFSPDGKYVEADDGGWYFVKGEKIE